jgi:hypothetical protein
MAHFAELDENNVVKRVIVIDDFLAENGEEYCKELFDGNWKQTSYNGSFRKQFATPGLVYSQEKDMFVMPQPKDWYRLNNEGEWESPLGTDPDTGKELEDWHWDWLDTVFAIDIHWGGNIG